ncbi:CDP-diacylglycerol--glycerol-3-phosphate 3-phosphatidyltransferase [Pikeienuella piscinae]|uniref:CDP-diacylglycerol--glycerol-3-phosphate 3-phosphatidyltransferase n=1 Tax=Pikeienuella piscinae TaxID=2748098 RepID=A0A7M3T573_9RHOB|nr:CDP-diacylglycerol--glycerol-3-phosphate 3-phosphatidyltransferase [Pikeienuella piscinae]QIE57154.1 CDP-diacylglycerol--glycerol-3-phosphate 3-phosphatidyltransferase [Pikeienuella piscinae]
MRLTIPNTLTIGRVVAAPLVAFVFLVLARPLADIVAFLLFTIAGLSDFLDGWLARRWGQVSAFGRMLDPIADKAMIAVTGAVLVGLFDLSAGVTIPVTVILVRETLVSGLREYLKGARVLDVTQLAKWKTTAQMIAFGALLLAGAVEAPDNWISVAGIALLWLAAALTALSGWDYFSKGLAYMKSEEERI